MKLDFERVTVTGYTEATFHAAVIGDTTILVCKDYTGEMSLAGFKTPELVVPTSEAVIDQSLASLRHSADAKPIGKVTKTERTEDGLEIAIEATSYSSGTVGEPTETATIISGKSTLLNKLQRRTKSGRWRKVANDKLAVGDVVRWDKGDPFCVVRFRTGGGVELCRADA
jgi:hypothetical protein